MQKWYIESQDLFGINLKEIFDDSRMIFQENALCFNNDEEFRQYVRKKLKEGETVSVLEYEGGIKRPKYSRSVYSGNTVTCYERKKGRNVGPKIKVTVIKLDNF